jgi:hypothetical protein
MKIELFLRRLKIDQLQKLVERYELQPKCKKRKIIQKALVKYMKTHGIGECPICFESNDYDIAVATPCAHIFCDDCLLRHLYKNNNCPMCREHTDFIYIIEQIKNYRILFFPPDSNTDSYEEPPVPRAEFHTITQLHPMNLLITMYATMYTFAFNICITIFVLYQMAVVIQTEFTRL